MSQKPPNQTLIADALADIAKKMSSLSADCKAAGVTDGYLTGLLTFLNTPISSASGSPSLMSLAAASPLDLDAFQSALTAETGDLSSFLATVQQYEYGG